MSQTHRRSKALGYREPWKWKQQRLNERYGEMKVGKLTPEQLRELAEVLGHER